MRDLTPAERAAMDEVTAEANDAIEHLMGRVRSYAHAGYDKDRIIASLYTRLRVMNLYDADDLRAYLVYALVRIKDLEDQMKIKEQVG